MKSGLYLLAFPLLALCATPAFADGPINYSTPVKPDASISFQMVAGSVKFKAWKQDKIQITGTLCAECKNTVEKNSAGLDIRIVRPRGNYYHDRGSRLVIRLPASVRLRVNTVSAGIFADDLTGSARLKSVSGDIGVQSKSANLHVRSVSGDIIVNGSAPKAQVDAHSISGEIHIKDVGGELSAGSVSGDIRLVANHPVTHAKLDTTSGDVEFIAPLAPKGDYAFHSTSGDVTLRLKELPAAQFDATSLSGDIETNFGPSPRRTSEYGPGKEWHYTSGDGGAEISVNTLSGDIRIRADKH